MRKPLLGHSGCCARSASIIAASSVAVFNSLRVFGARLEPEDTGEPNAASGLIWWECGGIESALDLATALTCFFPNANTSSTIAARPSLEFWSLCIAISHLWNFAISFRENELRWLRVA